MVSTTCAAKTKEWIWPLPFYLCLCLSLQQKFYGNSMESCSLDIIIFCYGNVAVSLVGSFASRAKWDRAISDLVLGPARISKCCCCLVCDRMSLPLLSCRLGGWLICWLVELWWHGLVWCGVRRSMCLRRLSCLVFRRVCVLYCTKNWDQTRRSRHHSALQTFLGDSP